METVDELLDSIWIKLLDAQRFFSKKYTTLLSGSGSLPITVRDRFYSKAKLICVYCGSTEKLTIDHKLARCLGGTNVESNLQVLCLPCNRKKGLLENELVNRLRNPEYRRELQIRYLNEIKPKMEAGLIRREERKQRRDESAALAYKIVQEQIKAEKAAASVTNTLDNP